jgi:serine/threonine protein kinase/formylglycine-generating enzyme required for sulfatase activity
MSFDSLPSTIRDELMDICDAFDAARIGELRPKIEVYLGARPEPERTVLFEMLLGIELEVRCNAGERPEPRDYYDRFPAHIIAINKAFAEGELGGDTMPGPPSETELFPAAPAPILVGTTIPREADPHREPDGAVAPEPDRIGRYTVVGSLGKGNFQVYLARDDLNDRFVAIKVARPDIPASRRRLMSLADEAEKLRALQHPRIVKLYEYVSPGEPGIGADGYIVLEYVEGRAGEKTLEELFGAGPVPVLRLIRVAALVAEALHYAHIHASHLVHRDLKPSNILLDLRGEPRICDFGLTIDEEIQRMRRGEIAGTPPYMAPEQVRGETNHLDGRTDIWALGVILYRGLTGKLPFAGADKDQIFEEILHRDPRPLRIYDPGLEPELERIVLRCLSRPMAERYLTAADLAVDLWRAVDEQPPSLPPTEPIVYKGLRPFGDEDARFFLSLLPGPRRGDGMPESVKFWKDLVEAVDAARAFSVGVLYGPSGGGKSSFVKAGLLPNLDTSRVRSVYLEATPGGTEARLLAELRRVAPALPVDVNLPDAVALVRDDPERRTAGKFFLILDQFEQWIQAHPNEPDAELVRALRQFDGRGVAVLVVVRDDFWMAVTRFLRAVDVPLVLGGNAAAVELFDARHARTVLEGFGRALGHRLDVGGTVTKEAALFFDEAVDGLSDAEGRVIPMRLSLFIEVVRNRPWTPETLAALGGVDGIGVKFLDDCFTRPEYKHYRGAAQAVLNKLLPPPTSMIRGRPCGGGELRAEAGYAEQMGEFTELIRVLAGELRLITVAETDGSTAAPQGHCPGPAVAAGETRYQLAHDFLVRPIRQWLEREKGLTRKGRAGLRLAVVTASWLERPGSRQLPSLLEWASILRHIPPREWSTDQRRLMNATARYYSTRGVAALAVLAAVGLGVQSIRAHDRAGAVFQQAIEAQPENLRRFLPEIAAQRGQLRPDLERVEGDNSAPVRQRTNACLLLHREQPTADRAAKLRARLADAGPDEVVLIRESLASDAATARGDLLLNTLRDESSTDSARLRVACALAGLSPVKTEDWTPAASALVEGLLGEDHRMQPQWLELLGPACAIIVPPLESICGNEGRDPTTRSTAAEALAWALSTRHDPARLAHALTGAQPEASLILLHELEQMSDRRGGLEYLEALAKGSSEPRDDRAVDRQAMAVVALTVLGQPDALRPAFRHRADPRLRTATIQKIVTLKLAPRVLYRRLPWAELDGAIRQAVLLTWAETPREGIPPAVRADVLKNVRDSFVDDIDPGVHSAARLLILRWQPDALPVLPAGTRKLPGPGVGSRGWIVGPNGHTLVFLRGPHLFRMGSPDGELKRYVYETQHERRIERSLLVATTETTVKQYLKFKLDHEPDPRYCEEGPGSLDNPVGGVPWYRAIGYCNWLSRNAGLEPFFPEEGEVNPGTKLPKGNRDGGGYRLPTEAEWEYICRAETETCRPFGDSDQYLDRYAWTSSNSRELLFPAGRLLPNELGLFDLLGSQWEWCLGGSSGADLYPAYPSGTKEQPALDLFGEVPVYQEDLRFVRGGAFYRGPTEARSAHRDVRNASYAYHYNGFRVVRTVTPEQDGHQ